MKSFYPDSIVLDMEMPQMNGVAVCAVLKNDSRTCRIPVLFLSGEGRIGRVEDALREGAGGYLTKPIDFSRLKTKIESCLAG